MTTSLFHISMLPNAHWYEDARPFESGGNRRFNVILYWITRAQARGSEDACTSLARRRAEGQSWREVTRALKRPLIRAI